MHPKRYLKNKEEFVQYKDQLKSKKCFKCSHSGYLVLYGAYKDKGHRCYCSNRYSKKGCGKTFVVYYQEAIENHIIKPSELWNILKKLLLNHTLTAAIKPIKYYTRRAINHWLNKLKHCQSTIRSNLIKISPPPSINTLNPLHQTIKHLELCFGKESAIMEYQLYFQRSIFTY